MHQVHKVAALLAEQIGTPRALTVEILLRYGEITQLQRLRADPSNYLLADAYFKDAIVTDLLRKLRYPGNEEACKRAAIDGFLACEKKNWKTNSRLYRFVDNYGLTPEDEPVMQFITAWRKEMERCLGPLPGNLTPLFSGGSTVTDRGALTTLPDKMTGTPALYPQTQCMLPLWWGTAWGRACAYPSPGFAPRHPSVVRYNVFFTVFKNSETDRGCCMEASVPLSYQLATGRLMRSRLLTAYGNDLVNGKKHHMARARKASLDNRVATIDLKDASNLLARALPELVLPNQWFELVDSLRAPMVLIDGRVQRLEMFSSMGNGCTFELETLIFQTLCMTILKQRGLWHLIDDVSVFGDDILVPVEIADDVLAALRYFGFEPNTRKTFVTGSFRESCGGDYFEGSAVRPHFLEKLPDEPQHWISLANGLWLLPQRWASRARMECFNNIPSQVRSCQGPEVFGDLLLHGPEKYWTPKLRKPRGEHVEVLHYRVYQPVAETLPWHHWRPEVVLASALAGADEDGQSPRNNVTGYRLSWVPAPGNAWLPTHSETRRFDNRFGPGRVEWATLTLRAELNQL